MTVKTIDMTPTWEALLPGLLMAVENGTNQGRAIAMEELMRLARFADRVNAANRDKNTKRQGIADPYDFAVLDNAENPRSMVYHLDTGTEVATFDTSDIGQYMAEAVCNLLNDIMAERR